MSPEKHQHANQDFNFPVAYLSPQLPVLLLQQLAGLAVQNQRNECKTIKYELKLKEKWDMLSGLLATKINYFHKNSKSNHNFKS